MTAPPAMPAPRPTGPESAPAPLRLRLRIDGREHTILLEARAELLDALREDLALKARKKR